MCGGRKCIALHSLSIASYCWPIPACHSSWPPSLWLFSQVELDRVGFGESGFLGGGGSLLCLLPNFCSTSFQRCSLSGPLPLLNSWNKISLAFCFGTRRTWRFSCFSACWPVTNRYLFHFIAFCRQNSEQKELDFANSNEQHWQFLMVVRVIITPHGDRVCSLAKLFSIHHPQWFCGWHKQERFLMPIRSSRRNKTRKQAPEFADSRAAISLFFNRSDFCPYSFLWTQPFYSV